MAVGPDTFPLMYPVAGFRLGVTRAHVRKPDRRDVVIMEAVAGSTVAGAFTTNAFCAAPVQVCREHLRDGVASGAWYLVTNTGFANAGTGQAGRQDCLAVCAALAEKTGVPVARVLPFSTGVIGERLPVDRIVAGLPAALGALDESNWHEAALGIMTTDTRPKGASVRLEFSTGVVHITGIAKGAGMIRPDMATMLSYVATDAAIATPLLQALIREAVGVSFNCATVDGDTSTNDSCVLVATGVSGVTIDEVSASELALFRAAWKDVLVQLAHAVVRDGEGATKFVTVNVEGARTVSEARDLAFSIAHSPLVKTALFASDPNWGRILAAAGRAGVPDFDVDRVSLWLDDVLVAEQGGLSPGYQEQQGAAVMAREAFTIRLVLVGVRARFFSRAVRRTCIRVTSGNFPEAR